MRNLDWRNGELIDSLIGDKLSKKDIKRVGEKLIAKYGHLATIKIQDNGIYIRMPQKMKLRDATNLKGNMVSTMKSTYLKW